MSPLIPASSLPGSDRSRQFDGEDHGVRVSFFLVNGEPGKGPKLHRHAYEEIFSIEAGNATFTVDGAELEAGPGDIVIVPPDTAHRFVNSGTDDLRLTAIHNASRIVSEWL
jgi:quercetin dioxygenase-like cupin family protein